MFSPLLVSFCATCLWCSYGHRCAWCAAGWRGQRGRLQLTLSILCAEGCRYLTLLSRSPSSFLSRLSSFSASASASTSASASSSSKTTTITGARTFVCSHSSPFFHVQVDGVLCGQPTMYATTLQTIRHVLREEGIRGFYVGLSINYLKVAPAVGISFVTYEFMKKKLNIM